MSIIFGLVLFAFYAWGAYPGVSVGDAGEFITAAATLGIPHPPGFPSFTLLARLWGELVPIGAWAYRVNLFSAACMAAAGAILFASFRRAAFPRWAALAGASVFALAQAAVINARASEVFGLHALFIASLVWTVLERRWVLAAYLLGLAVGNHQTAIFFLPALLWAAWKSNVLRRSLLLLGFFLLGFSTHTFLYIRAQDKPFLNVGNPSTLERWLRVVRRADYGTLTLALGEAPPRDVTTGVKQMARFGKGLLHEGMAIPFLLAVFGFLFWRQRDPIFLSFLILSFVFIGPFFFWLGNLPFDAQSEGVLDRFFILPLLLLSMAVAGGLVWLERRRPKATAWLSLPLLVTPLLALTPASFRQDFGIEAYWRNHFRTLPFGAHFIMDGGDDTFYSMAYATQVLRRRLDVTFHDRGGVVFSHPYGDDFRRLDRVAKEERRQQVEAAFATSGRSLYYSTMNPYLLRQHELRLSGILYSVAPRPPHYRAGAPEVWRARFRGGDSFIGFYDLRGMAPWMASPLEPLPDYRRRSLYPFYAYQAGIFYRDRLFLESARRWGKDALWLEANVAQALASFAPR